MTTPMELANLDEMPDDLQDRVVASYSLGIKLIDTINGAAELEGLPAPIGAEVTMSALINVLGMVLRNSDDPADKAKLAADALMGTVLGNTKNKGNA
jgi:hypothetical protein